MSPTLEMIAVVQYMMMCVGPDSPEMPRLARIEAYLLRRYMREAGDQ